MLVLVCPEHIRTHYLETSHGPYTIMDLSCIDDTASDGILRAISNNMTLKDCMILAILSHTLYPPTLVIT